MTNKFSPNIIYNKWIDFYYKIDSPLLMEINIFNAVTSLFSNFNNISNNSIILIQLKVKIENNYRSISYLQIIKIFQLNELIEIFIEFWNLRDEDYINLNISDIILTYKIIESNIDITKLNKSRDLIKDNNILFNFKGYN